MALSLFPPPFGAPSAIVFEPLERIQRRWIGIHEGNSIFRIVRDDEALLDSPPLLFPSSHFRRICADLAARFAINRSPGPVVGTSRDVGLRVDPLNTIGKEKEEWKFRDSQLREDYLSLVIPGSASKLISSRRRDIGTFDIGNWFSSKIPSV